jgi:hypothetical protein
MIFSFRFLFIGSFNVYKIRFFTDSKKAALLSVLPKKATG